MHDTLATTIHVAARKQRTGRTQTKSLDLFINRRVLLDISVGARNVRFRLIVIEVADEILDRVARKELFELRVKLRRERFVVRDDKRRPVQLANDICGRESLSRARDPQQRLMAIPRLDRLQQLRDRLRLIAARFIV